LFDEKCLIIRSKEAGQIAVGAESKENGDNLSSVRCETGISCRTKKEYVKWGKIRMITDSPPLLPAVT
jgi:hypothetical protein